MILWHQYQCTLYIVTRNAILWSHGMAFHRTYLWIFAGSLAYANRYFPNSTCCQALQHIECFILWQCRPSSSSSYHSNFALSVCEMLFCLDEECWLICWINHLLWWVCVWVFCCCRDAGTVVYVRCLWCCQGPLFFSVLSARTTTDQPSTPPWHCTVQHCVVHIVQHHVYLCTSTLLLSTPVNQ
jgi:hypothetical protein